MQSSFALKSLLIVLTTAVVLLGQTAIEKKPADAKPEVVPITQEEHHHLVNDLRVERIAPHQKTDRHLEEHE